MTVVRQIRPDQLGQLHRALAAARPKAVQRGLEKAGVRALKLLKARTTAHRIRPGGPMGSGWRAEATSMQLTLRNVAPHARYVEGGRMAGARQPPVMALVPWVQRVLGVPESRARSVAFLVARKIARRGIAPRPILTAVNVLNQLAQIATREVGDAVTTPPSWWPK